MLPGKSECQLSGLGACSMHGRWLCREHRPRSHSRGYNLPRSTFEQQQQLQQQQQQIASSEIASQQEVAA